MNFSKIAQAVLCANFLILVGCNDMEFAETPEKIRQREMAEAARGPKILTPPPMTPTRLQLNVEGTCEPGFDVRLFGEDLLAEITLPCPDGQFGALVELAGEDGSKRVEAVQTLAEGDDRRDLREFLKDTEPPAVTVDAPAPGTESNTSIPVSGQCEDGLAVDLFEENSGNWAASTICLGGSYLLDFPLLGVDGPKPMIAVQIDLVGNIGTADSMFVKDATPPVVELREPLANSWVGERVIVEGRCENGLPVEISGHQTGAGTSLTCSQGEFRGEVSITVRDGPVRISASQTDRAGNIGSDNHTVRKDTTAPVVQITAPLAQHAFQSGLTLSGRCENGLEVEISGSGLTTPVRTACNQGQFQQALTIGGADGRKDLVARQTDGAGNTGTDSRSFIKDATAPDVEILAPAENSLFRDSLTLSGRCETGLPVQLSGDIAAAAAISCQNGQFTAQITLSGADGNKRVTASQTDAAGNNGSDSRTYRKDTTAPLVRITAPAAGTRAQNGLRLQGQCETGLSVAFSGAGLASPAQTSCTSGSFSVDITFTAGDGTKEIIAAQTDAAGNRGQDMRTFMKDTTGPDVKITAPAAGTRGRDGLTISGTCEAGLDVQLTGSGLARSAQTNCPAGSFNVEIQFSNGDGEKEVIASQTDTVGNTSSDSRTFIRDTDGPALQITAPAPLTTAQTGVKVQGICEGTQPVEISGAGIATATQTSCVSGTFSVDLLFSSGDGTKTIVATQKDDLGNSATDTRDFIRDSTAPDIEITAPVAGHIAQNGVKLQGHCETGLPVEVFGSGASSASQTTCNSGRFEVDVIFSNGDGNKQIQVAQTDAAGNRGTDSRTFVRDTQAPLVKITSPAAQTAAQNGVRLQGQCETGLNVALSGAGLASPTQTSCTSGSFSVDIVFSNGDGGKLITASQTDAAGNIGSDSRIFVKDTTAPAIRITAPAADTRGRDGLTIEGVCETGLNVALSGAGLASPAQTSCAAGSFKTDILFSAGDGTKEIIASQTDALGNSGTDRRSFVRHTQGPALQITAPAPLTPAKNGLTLEGTCEGSFPVLLGGAGLASPNQTTCNAGRFQVAIIFQGADGIKTITASQTDDIGNTSTDSRDFIKDTQSPRIRITGPAANTRAQTGLTLVGECENDLSVLLGGAGLQSPTQTTCSNGTFSVAILFTNGDGNKAIEVRQTDRAGNSSQDQRTFIRDTKGPEFQITAPAALTRAAGELLLEGRCEDAYSVRLSGSGLDSPAQTTCSNGRFAVQIKFTAGDGVKPVTGSQTDDLGNITEDSRDFINDTTAPLVKITSPAAQTAAQNGVRLQGQCETGLNVALSGAGLASPTQTSCTSGSFSVDIVFSNGDGNKQIQVAQTDAAGNTGSDSRTFVKDTTAPAIRITAPAAGTRGKDGLTLEGTCETGLNVALSGAGLASPNQTACASGRFQVDILFSSGDGNKLITASQTDAVGNSATDSRTFVRDTQGPALRITAPAPMTAAQNGVQLVGTCESTQPVRLSGAGLASPTQTSCTAGSFNVDIVFSIGEGTKTIVASQTDDLGNTATDSRNFVKDTTAPAIRITAPAAQTAAQNGVSLAGTCESGLTVHISGAGVAAASETACTNGQFQSNISFSAGDGSKPVRVTQTDAAGNTGSDERSFIRDTIKPLVQITAPAANTRAQTGVRLQGQCETGLSVALSGAGLASPAQTSCTSGSFSVDIVFSNGDGNKVIVASQTDAAGNTGSDSRTFVKDTTAPAIRITAPAAGTRGKDGLTLEGTCEAGLDVRLSGSGLTAATQTSCTAGSFQAAVQFSDGDGVKRIAASQTDAVGNTGSDSRDFARDTMGPLVKITAPNAGTIAKSGLRLSGECENGYPVELLGTGLASPSQTTCTSGRFEVNIQFTAGDGNKLITARQTDDLGNFTTDSRTFVRDSTAPVILITQPAANTRTRNGVTLEGTCENGHPIVLGGAGLGTPNAASCQSGAFRIDVTFNSGDGSKTVSVSQTDAAGNTGTDFRTFIKDATPPGIRITSPAAGSHTNGTVHLVGVCENGFGVQLGGAGLSSPASTTCQAGAFSVDVIVTAGDGSKQITVSQTDDVGNTGSDSRSFVKDTLAPVVKFTAPAAGTAATNGLLVSGTCETGIDVALYGPGTAAAIYTPCASGSFSQFVNFSAGDGDKTFYAAQTDGAGNMGSDTRVFRRDSTAPTIRITGPAANTRAQTGVTVVGTCEAGLDVVLSGAGANAAVTTACSAGSFSAFVAFSNGEGGKTIQARQTDAAGNSAQDSRQFIRDNTAPSLVINAPSEGSNTRSSSVVVSGTCESGLNVDLFGPGLANPLSVSCSGGSFTTPASLSAGDGSKTIIASQTDAAGNNATDSVSVMKDTVAPVVTITSPDPSGEYGTSITIEGTCESGLGVSISGSGVSAPVSTTCISGQFRADITFTGGNGTKQVIASQTDAAGNTGSAMQNFLSDGPSHYETFTASFTQKVDILFVVDNSFSMEQEQASLGKRFNSFIAGLQGIDWQIGITTTDCSTGPYGICGSILQLTGSSSRILTPAATNAATLFRDTVQRPETIDCANNGTCPSGLEEALKATYNAFLKRNTDNAGLFREGADVAVVILMDEDEQSDGRITATKPQMVIDTFKSIWGSTTKRLSSYGIIIEPGDTACYNFQRTQSGGVAFYGTHAAELALRTGGVTGSICDADYSATLSEIGENVKKLTDSVELEEEPDPASVTVVFTPNHATSWSVQGNKVIFDVPPPAGTRIEVFYDPL